MRFVLLALELAALVVTSVCFVMGFNKMHGAQMTLHAGADGALTDEALRLIEQAHSMFTIAAICGGIFVVLFIIRLIRNAVAQEFRYTKSMNKAHAVL